MLAPQTFQPRQQRWERLGVQPLAPMRHQSPLKNKRRSDDVIVREHHVTLQEERLLSLDYRIAFAAEIEDLNDPAELDYYSCWRSVCLRELTYIPVEEREESDILGRSHALLRGVWDEGTDLIYIAAGCYQPVPIGIRQIYGTGCQAWDRDSASRAAVDQMEAMNATLHGAWPFAQTQALSWASGADLMEKLTTLDQVTALLGHPDPRKTKKGMGHNTEGAIGTEDEELAAQQCELMLRALGKLRRNYLYLVTAAALHSWAINKALGGVAERTSDVASRQRGNLSSGMSVGVPMIAGMNHGLNAGLGASEGASVSVGESLNAGWTEGASAGWTEGVSEGGSYSVSEGMSESRGVGENLGAGESMGATAGTSTGHSLNAGENIGENVGESQGRNWSAGRSVGTSDSYSDSRSASWGQSLGESTSESATVGTSQGATQGTTQGTSQGTTQGTSSGQTTGLSTGHSSSWNTGLSQGTTQGTSQGTSQGASQGTSQGASQGTSQGWNAGTSEGNTQSASATLGGGALPASLAGSLGQSQGSSDGVSAGSSQGSSTGSSAGSSQGSSAGSSQGSSQGSSAGAGGGQTTGSSAGASVGTSTGSSQGSSTGISQGTSVGTSQGYSATAGSSRGETIGGSHSVGRSQGVSTGATVGEGGNTGVSVGQSHGQSRGESVTRGGSAGASYNQNASYGQSRNESVSRNWSASESRNTGRSAGISGGTSVGTSGGRGTNSGRSLNSSQNLSSGFSRGNSLSTGLSPGWNIGRSWNTEDDKAMLLTEVYRGLRGHWNEMRIQGGFFVTALLLTDLETLSTARRALVQALAGPRAVIPVQAVHVNRFGPAQEEAVRIRNLAQAFLTSVDIQDPEQEPTGSRLRPIWSTALAPAKLAALVSPNLYEEGSLKSTQHRPPPMAYYPDMDGDVTLGYFYGPETGELTGLPVRLSQKRHFHTLFGGDTGFGKTVAAERMVVETTAKWHMKSIVLDFGYGWRKLVNVPELQGHVDVRQLTNGVRPIRWNPLQVSRNISPEVHWRRVCEVFGGCTGLGASRQLPELMTMLHNVYVRAGVLVDDPFVFDERYRDTPVPVPLLGREPDGSWADPLPLEPGMAQIQPWTNPGWYKVRDAEEASACGWPVETRLVDMAYEDKQKLGRWRSRRVGPMHLMVACKQKVDDPELGGDMRGYLQGISARLDLLLQGQYRVMYAHGPDVPDICDIVPAEWGVTVLEGGAQMDAKMKSFLLGWAGWIIFTDAVVQRMEAAQTRPAHLQLIFEEANKIFSAESGRGHDDAVQGQSTGELWESLWRDSRKYGVFLHCITQNPSQLPPGIVSSSNNMILAQLKNPKDIDIIMSQLHRSGKGFHDEEWRRYLGSIPIAESICKLGYTQDRTDLEPMRIRPLLVDVDEPDDRQLGALLAHWNQAAPGGP